MPRTVIVEDVVAIAGVAETFVAADQANGMMFVNAGSQLIHVKNTNVATRTVTFTTPATRAGLAIADPAIVIPANTGDLLIGKFPTAVYNQQSGADKGKVYLDFDADTGVTIALVNPG